MLIKEIIKQPIVKILEKDDIWRMIDEILLNCNSDDFDLKNNTKIKMNILLEAWDEENNLMTVYTIIFEEKIIGVGGILEDNEDTFKHETHFIDKQGYIDMINYLYTLVIKKEIDAYIQSLDYDFKL
jgi:hypothetical protein